MASGFLILLSFFTRIPVGRHIEYDENNFRRALGLFAFVGAIAGVFLAVASVVGQVFHNSLIKGLLVTVCYTVVTGGIHLDGTADTSDGLFSGRSGERIFEIMSDSKIGAFGVLSLIFIIISQVILFSSLTVFECFMVPVAGRTAIAVGSYGKKYAKKTPGMGTIFVESMTAKIVISNVVILLVLSAALPGRTVLILSSIASMAAARAISRWIEGMIGGMTGDTCGFTAEMVQIVFMLMVTAIRGMIL